MASCVIVSREIGGVPIDVVLYEEHESTMTIADHPVERGAEISDHAWREARRVRIEGVVDAPLAVAAYEGLLAVQEAAEPFDLVTGLKIYRNMLIEQLFATRDKATARVLNFEADLREVIIVDTQTSAGSPEAGTTADRASPRVNRGQVQAREFNNSTVLDTITASQGW